VSGVDKRVLKATDRHVESSTWKDWEIQQNSTIKMMHRLVEDVMVERMSVAEKDIIKSVDRQVEKTVQKKMEKAEQESTKDLLGSIKAAREAVKSISDLEVVVQVTQKVESKNVSMVTAATDTLKDNIRREFGSKLTEVEQKMASRTEVVAVSSKRRRSRTWHSPLATVKSSSSPPSRQGPADNQDGDGCACGGG